MIRFKSSHLAPAIAMAAIVMLGAGGVVVASNMGFKINLALAPGGAGRIGDNWISLPNNKPYNTVTAVGNNTGCDASLGGVNCVAAFCTATGLPNLTTTVFQQNADTGGSVGPVTCGTATARTTPIGTSAANPQERAVRIRVNVGQNIIVVGSHDPARQEVLYPTDLGGRNGWNWISIPYHTTAVTAGNFCTQAGLPNFLATIFSTEPVSGGNIGPVTCGTAGANGLNLVLGRAYRVLSGQAAGNKTFIPAHY